MSALGQKQTCAMHKGMSALPPIADMCSATRDVRFVPIADIGCHGQISICDAFGHMARPNFTLSDCRSRIWRGVSWQAARPYRASVKRRIVRQIVQSCHRSLLGPTCKAPSIWDELRPLFWPVSDRPLGHPEFSSLRTIDQLALHPQIKAIDCSMVAADNVLLPLA